jgi:hypothetical protein
MQFSFSEAVSMAVGLGSLVGVFLTSITFSRKTEEYHRKQRERESAAEDRLKTMERAILEIGRKVDLSNPDTRILWLFHMRRAELEANDAGYGKMESPFTWDSDQIRKMNPLREKLLEFHRTEGKYLDAVSAIIKIEDRFGAEIVEKVCIPNGMKNGECLLLALCVSRGTRTVNLEAKTDGTEEGPGPYTPPLPA